MIIRSLVVSVFGTNCYIVGSETTNKGLIIDPGGEANLILSTVREKGLSIELIIVTHAHGDHTGALVEAKRLTGAKFAIHEDEYVGLTPRNFRNTTDVSLTLCDGIIAPDQWLHDGDKIKVSQMSFTVIHTPGHTSGGICLYGEGILFSGDTLFNYGIGRTDFPGGDYNTLINSIRNKLLILPDDTIVYPGHGPATTIRDEKRGNPFLR